MSVTEILGMSQTEGSLEELTTDEVMQALFPKGVIDRANDLAGATEANGSTSIGEDASGSAAL